MQEIFVDTLAIKRR